MKKNKLDIFALIFTILIVFSPLLGLKAGERNFLTKTYPIFIVAYLAYTIKFRNGIATFLPIFTISFLAIFINRGNLEQSAENFLKAYYGLIKNFYLVFCYCLIFFLIEKALSGKFGQILLGLVGLSFIYFDIFGPLPMFSSSFGKKFFLLFPIFDIFYKLSGKGSGLLRKTAALVAILIEIYLYKSGDLYLDFFLSPLFLIPALASGSESPYFPTYFLFSLIYIFRPIFEAFSYYFVIDESLIRVACLIICFLLGEICFSLRSKPLDYILLGVHKKA